MRNTRPGKFVLFLAAALAAVLAARGSDAATIFKIGTLAPGDSPWGKEFKRLAADVARDTNGEMQLDFQWNGQAGDEVLMVQKIRAGQLDAAAVTTLGLAQTGVTDVLLFQLPGLFTSWAKLDAARDALRDDFDRLFEAKGFTVLGWGDIGEAKTMTVGFEVHHPADLRGKGVFFLPGDPVQPRVYSAIGGITAHSIGVAEILPGLISGSINVVTAPPLVAEQLQWASRVTHLNTETLAFAIGATIASTSRLQSIPPDVKEVMARRGRESSERLTRMVRSMDARAFDRMKAHKTTYGPTDTDRAEWKDLFTRVCKELRGTVFSAAMFDKVVRLADNPLISKP